MRSFSSFDAALPPDQVSLAEADRLRSLATWAYLLLRPGLEFVRQRSNFILGWQTAAAAGVVGRTGKPPLGSWMILPELTDPSTQTVLPSNDALYGAAHVELDLLGPVVIRVPANVDDRYFSVSVMDAHFNNVGRIGPRWTGNDAVDVFVVPPGWAGTPPDGMRVIQSPTLSVCLFNRMLVRYSPGDADRVRRWQAGLRVTPLRHFESPGGGPDEVPDDVPVDAFVHPDINTLTDPFGYLTIGLEHLRRNPLAESAGWLSHLIATAGFDMASADPLLSTAVADGVDEATRMLDATLTVWPRRGGWMVPDAALGRPNPQVLRSAAFQQFQIGSNEIEESAYYFSDTDTAGRALDGRDEAVYELRFPGGALPPIHPGGYWSVTMYDEHSLLVENRWQQYATRPDRPGFSLDDDGGATVVMSAAPPAPGREANWLPAPTGRFRVGLRIYYPDDAAIDGTWFPPALVRRDDDAAVAR